MPISTPNKYRINIKGMNVTPYVVKSRIRKTNQPIKSAEIVIKKDVNITIDTSIIGKEVIITRGFDSPTEKHIFRGEIIKQRKVGSLYELTCMCKMNRANRLETNYVYDKDIDVEGGVGSEIVKSLFNNIGLNYSVESIPTTGVSSQFLIRTFKANGSTMKSLNKLASVYKRKYFYNDEDDLAYFVEPKSTSSGINLETGVNVVGRISWNETGEDIINNLTVIGGKQLDWTEEDFTGTFSEVELVAPPVDTEIIVSGNHLERGVNSVDPKDFYTDSSNKKIIFTSPVTNPKIRYSYSVPIKVQYADIISMNNTYRVDRTHHDTNIFNSDDAELYAKGKVDDNKDTLNNAPIRVIGNNSLRIGNEVRVIDHINNYDLLLDVNGLTIHYPYLPDEVDVGKKPLDELDRDRKILERLRDLEVQATDSGDISVSLLPMIDAEVEVDVFVKVEKASADTGVLYWDSDVQGDWDDFDWGTDTEETYVEVYKESGYDD